MFEFKNAVQVPITPRVSQKVKCISKPNTKAKITIGKKYMVNMISIFTGNFRLTCDTGRNVWYDKSHFKVCK